MPPGEDSPPAPADEWWDRAQVVEIRRSRLQPAAVEVAVVMRVSEGRFVHRRMRCSGLDVLSCLKCLCDADPDALAHSGDPSTPRQVRDQFFAYADEALSAAQQQRPPADPQRWRRPEAGILDEGFDDKVKPEAERVGRLASVAVAAVFLAAFLPLLFGIGLLVERFPGLAAGEADGEGLLVMVALFAASTVAVGAAEVIGRQNLARERSRSVRLSPGGAPAPELPGGPRDSKGNVMDTAEPSPQDSGEFSARPGLRGELPKKRFTTRRGGANACHALGAAANHWPGSAGPCPSPAHRGSGNPVQGQGSHSSRSSRAHRDDQGQRRRGPFLGRSTIITSGARRRGAADRCPRGGSGCL